MNPNVGQFRGFGHPRESPPYEVSVDPTMQRMLLELNAGREAKRLATQAEMNTPEGRKKAAEAKLAEKKRKESHWLSRVIFDHGDGWKPIWGNAKNEELKIYTVLDSGEHRFWGIKPIGMSVDDFWEKYDPEVKRYEDRQQETPVNPDSPTGPLIGEPPRSLPPPSKAAAKTRKSRKSPEIDPTHRVRKSTTESSKVGPSKAEPTKVERSKVNKKIRKSLPQQKAPTTAHSTSRPTRNKTAVPIADSQQDPATEQGTSTPSSRPRGRPAATKQKPDANDRDALPSKRPRGRPPTKARLAEKNPKHKKTTAVKGNARVTKSARPSAPSVHNMRTRRKGPAEILQLP